MIEFKVPELGENVAGGDVASVLVKVGDTIAVEQPVVELETDKATIEVPSSVAGVVKEIKVKKGDKIKVGAVILTVDEAAGNGAGAAKPAKDTRAAEPAEPAEPAEAAEAVEPEPAEEEAETPPPEKEQKVVAMARPQPAKPAEAQKPAPAAAASPSVRRLARELGVDVNEVQGTGAERRISQDDVKEHARRILSSVGAARSPAQPAGDVALPDFTKWGEVERQPMTAIRRKTAEHLSHAWRTIPHVTQFDKADITGLEELRKKYREQVSAAGGNLTVTAMLVKVIATAVKQFPQFNASLDTQSNDIIYKKYVNVGVAVDTDRGLLVPVVRNADQKNITDIAIGVHQLAEKARNRKLTLEILRKEAEALIGQAPSPNQEAESPQPAVADPGSDRK